jgi:signal transduction histidine kinase
MLDGYNEKQLFEVSLTSLKGNRKDAMIYISTIRNVDGEIIGGISVGTDITETKKQQEKMIQQEKLALLGQMGAGIVHETRNFLTTIKGRCQLIGLLGENEKVKEHAVKINAEVDEVNKIISEFLFLSKPREAELEDISMLDIFESIKSMVGATSLIKGVDVEFEFCREERYLLCDEAQLKQVILNMYKNAVDAMAGSLNAKLKIETCFDEITNEMLIKITDNGSGISEEDLKKIGTPFFTTKETGTGLGLNVCYKIIKDHGGRIDVQSRIGEGTTFTITLPCIGDEELDEVI